LADDIVFHRVRDTTMMIMTLRFLLPCFLALAGMAGCVKAPEKKYTANELVKIDRIAEVMRVSYADAKPVWPFVKKDPLTAEDFALLERAGERLEGAAAALTNLAKDRPEGFQDLARTLQEEAAKIHQAGQASDAEAARAAIKTYGDTCSACHKRFK